MKDETSMHKAGDIEELKHNGKLRLAAFKGHAEVIARAIDKMVAPEKIIHLPRGRKAYTAAPKLRKQRRTHTNAANTCAFDNILNWLFKEHGIAAFHVQDERLSEKDRLVLLMAANRVRSR